MPQYDLNQDTPYGLASADFPITLYDRPALMMGNILRGDVDGLTRAMLSPSTLSPAQMKTTRDFLLQGKKPNPIVKTILDVATNPLVIIGLGLGLVKFPLGTTKPLLALRKGLLPKVAAMGEKLAWTSDAMQNLRTVPGLWENLYGTWKATQDFVAKHWDDLNGIFLKNGQLNKTERYAVAAHLDGLHKTSNDLYKLLRNEPEYIAFYGSGDVPIAAGMQAKMGPRLQSFSDQVRGWFKRSRAPIMENKEVRDRVANSVESKGMKFGEDVEDYLSHHGQYDKYYAASVRGTTGTNYRNWMRKEITEKIGPEEFARMGLMSADPKHLMELEQAGFIPKGFMERVYTPTLRRWSDDAAGTAKRLWADIEKTGMNEGQQRVAFVNQMTEYYTKGAGKNLNFVGRLGNPKRAMDTLDAMAGALQKAKFGGPESVQQEFLSIGEVLGKPATYSLDLPDVAGRYLNNLAPSYVFHGLGYRDEFVKIMQTPNVFEGAPWIESYVMDDLAPHILGIKGWSQMKRSLTYTVQKAKIGNWVENHPLPRSILGDKGTKWISDWYKQSKVFASAESRDAAIASNFYLSTMGLNLSSSAKNSLQSFVTTINAVGPQGMYYGLKGAAGEEGLLVKLGQYGDELVKTGFSAEAREAAFKKAFPEFVADAGEAHKIVSSMLAGDIEKEGLARAGKMAGGLWEKIKTGMMMPFATTESGNRLLAYYSGRNAHLVQNAARMTKGGTERLAVMKEAGDVGQTLNMMTNFTGGPLGMPKALLNLPPQYRQFMHFPLRMVGFMGGSVRMGEDAMVRNWGTIGRMLAGSTALSIGGRNLLGTDLSGGLLTGALPLPQYEKSPFYPFPFVPPIAQVAGTAIKSLATGDVGGLGDVGALLVPGGIAARRAYKSISPRFADYKNPTQDGRVPLYNNDGALIGAMTPMELTMRAIGLRPASLSAEAGAAKWLLGQRDRIRQYRRDYTQAIFENDTQQAEKVNRGFQKVYPELGPIQIKKSDIRALENRREISRLNRIAGGISKSYRPLFEQVIGEASLGRLTEDIQVGGLDVLQGYLPNP